jgi:putrescine aminotransferase
MGSVPSEVRFTPAEKKQLEQTFGRYVNRGQVNYLKAGHLDVVETKREGVRFTDPVSGRPFFDGFTSAGSFNVGRHNPEIMAILDNALAEFDLGTHHLISEPKVNLAKKLAAIAPGDLNRVLFAAGGGDAVDAALKLARAATGRTQIISTVKAYHGHTGFALAANGKEHYRHYCEPLIPDFAFVPFGDLAAMQDAVTDRTAAIIIEPIQGEAGIFVGEDDYLAGLRKLCDDTGALLVFDEIQTAWGRTGKLFACDHSGVVPDMMTLAKSIGGGLFTNAALLYRPLPAVVAYVEEHPEFHFSTTGGTDLGCVVSLAVIDYVLNNDLPGRAAAMGERLLGALRDLQRENPKIIKDVRGRGLMIGIEYLHEFMGPMMSDALAQNGLFAAYSGNAPQVMRFMLPLVITDEEMDRVIAIIGEAVATMKKLLPFALPAAKFPPVLRLLNSEKVQTVLFGWIRRIEDAVAALRGKQS